MNQAQQYQRGRGQNEIAKNARPGAKTLEAERMNALQNDEREKRAGRPKSGRENRRTASGNMGKG